MPDASLALSQNSPGLAVWGRYAAGTHQSVAMYIFRNEEMWELPKGRLAGLFIDSNYPDLGIKSRQPFFFTRVRLFSLLPLGNHSLLTS